MDRGATHKNRFPVLGKTRFSYFKRRFINIRLNEVLGDVKTQTNTETMSSVTLEMPV